MHAPIRTLLIFVGLSIIHPAAEALAQRGGTSLGGSRCGDGLLGLTYLVPRAEATDVFSGTVSRVEKQEWAEVVTFNVDRVWKGNAPSVTTVYRPIYSERVDFEVGEKYFVLAHEFTPTERAEFRVAASATDGIAIGPCGDGTRHFSIAEPELPQLGAGHAPR